MPTKNDQHCGVPVGQRQCDVSVAAEPKIPDIDWRKGFRRPLGAAKIPGNYAGYPRMVRKFNHRDLSTGDGLIAAGSHLILRGKIDPKLHHLERTTGLRKRCRMILLVEYAAGGSHPLDVSGPDNTAVACRILMLDLAVIDDGDSLESAMRVLTDTATLGGRREIVRSCIVEQQEGADMAAQRVIGKERANRETVAHPMAAIVAVAAENRLLHRSSPRSRWIVLISEEHAPASLGPKDCNIGRIVLLLER